MADLFSIIKRQESYESSSVFRIMFLYLFFVGSVVPCPGKSVTQLLAEINDDSRLM